MTSQKDVFLETEGDAWFKRNAAALDSRDWAADPICVQLAKIEAGQALKVLEIGCGDGARLSYLRSRANHRVSGIDPSASAVARAVQRGIDARRATADRLPFDDASFDVVIFGFCLYLCDDSDLFRIAAEADRVLADPGWLLILDFDARGPVYRPYHHAPGLVSRKMDYRSLFAWHPAYTLADYQKFHHVSKQWTDDPDEWVSLAALRKRLRK
jgi:SAM-dependent methyltransferase